jgi:hypothetical protein
VVTRRACLVWRCRRGTQRLSRSPERNPLIGIIPRVAATPCVDSRSLPPVRTVNNKNSSLNNSAHSAEANSAPPLPCAGFHFLLLFQPPPNVTPRCMAFWCVAPTLRLSLRAMTVVFTFPRANVFNMLTSSFVHGRSFVVFTTSVPHAPMLPTNQRRSYNKTARLARRKCNVHAGPRRPPHQPLNSAASAA